MRVLVLTLATALLCVVPFWLAPVVPTTDGPAHLYNAWLLLHFDDPGLQAGAFSRRTRSSPTGAGSGRSFRCFSFFRPRSPRRPSSAPWWPSSCSRAPRSYRVLGAIPWWPPPAPGSWLTGGCWPRGSPAFSPAWAWVPRCAPRECGSSSLRSGAFPGRAWWRSASASASSSSFTWRERCSSPASGCCCAPRAREPGTRGGARSRSRLRPCSSRRARRCALGPGGGATEPLVSRGPRPRVGPPRRSRDGSLLAGLLPARPGDRRVAHPAHPGADRRAGHAPRPERRRGTVAGERGRRGSGRLPGRALGGRGRGFPHRSPRAPSVPPAPSVGHVARLARALFAPHGVRRAPRRGLGPPHGAVPVLGSGHGLRVRPAQPRPAERAAPRPAAAAPAAHGRGPPPPRLGARRDRPASAGPRQLRGVPRGWFPLSFRPEGLALGSAWRDGGTLPPGAVAVRFE